MKLVLFLLIVIHQTMASNSTIKQIQECGVHCSKGLQCKSRPHLSLTPCKKQHIKRNVTDVYNVLLSTVVRCDGKKCSLKLNIVAIITPYDDVRGISMCVHSAGLLGRCQILTPNSADENVTGTELEFRYDCFSVRPAQDVFVTVKTVPNYCDDIWTQKYTVPECSHEDIGGRVTECITGELKYTVNPVRRDIIVMVSKAPEETDYHLRLCLKGRTCVGTGAHRLINKEDLHRNVSLQYSDPLPCLCIEGWPARNDARRIQVCPFKNDVELLWSGVTYDHYEKALSWKPMCPVKAVVSLCHAVGPNICLDLRNTSVYFERHNVIFSTVDPHPQLCIKFTTEARSWIECPFSSQHFPVWDLKVAFKAGEQSAEISSWFPAKFSVGLCKMDNTTCKPTEESPFVNISVDKMKPATVNLSANMCHANICIQVRRIDVQLAIQEHRCNFQCSDQLILQWSYSEHLRKYTLPFSIFVITFVIAAMVCNATFKACGWRREEQKMNKNTQKHVADKHPDPYSEYSEDMDLKQDKA